MGVLAYFVSVGCIIGGLGVGLSNLAAMDISAAAGPPVLSDSDMPETPRPAARPRAASFDADRYGQFWIDGSANGLSVRFLVDTGASDVTFSKRDARRLGIDVNRLRFDGRASTANGIVRTATARLSRLAVGPFNVIDLPVSINDGELDFPLLGMAFLRRMNVAINNGTLTLSGE